MLRLPCPHCGERGVVEFRYGEIPTIPEDLTDPAARDLDRLFLCQRLLAQRVGPQLHDEVRLPGPLGLVRDGERLLPVRGDRHRVEFH